MNAMMIPPPERPSAAASNTAPANTGAAIVQIGIGALGFTLSVILAGIVEKSLRGLLKIKGLRSMRGVLIKALAGWAASAERHLQSQTLCADAGERQESHVFLANVLSASVNPISPVLCKCG